ncbi:MAG TPA: DUF1573 domain-containing protein [Thermoanaerobaculia bacterium]|nr:DUF1573 domain-containing protein [Thermoanaerobaculia bacterium]
MNVSVFGGRAKARPFLFLGVTGWLLGAGLAVAAPSAPTGAIVPRPRFDFGRVRRGEKVVHAFAVHNSGSARLAFTGAELSMPGMTCRTSPPLDPGADGTITIEWKTDRVQGTVDGVAQISTNDPSAPPIALALSGRVEGPLEIDPMPAVFLSTFRGEDLHRDLTLRAEKPVSLRLLSGEGAHFRAKLDPSEAGKSWRLDVRAAPDLPPGHYDETLAIDSDDSSIGRVTIPVHLFVKADLYANPDDVDFGSVPLSALRRGPGGDPLLSQSFFVKKRSGTFRILRIASDVPGLDLKADPAGSPSASFQVEARFRQPVRPGPLDGTITIETDDPRFRIVTVRVRGRIAG